MVTAYFFSKLCVYDPLSFAKVFGTANLWIITIINTILNW